MHNGYLDEAILHPYNTQKETIANFCFRILASRTPNVLPRYSPFVLKKLTNNLVTVTVVGVPEGKILLFDAVQIDSHRNVTIRNDQLDLHESDYRRIGEAQRGAVCTYDQKPMPEAALLQHTTFLLGEMGLYSGIDIEWWQTVSDE